MAERIFAMKTSWYRNLRGKKSLLWLSLSLGILIVALIATGKPVLADAGGWPTATPIPTLTPTQITPIPTPLFMPSPTPQSQGLLFPPTPTFTPVLPGFAQEFAAPQIMEETTTQTADGPLFSLLTLLPFIVIFGLLGTVGIYWLRARARPPQ
jgi:hypothetical protein